MDVYASGDVAWRNPITAIAGCCACAARGQTAILPPINVMNSRRLTGYPLRPGPYLTTSQVALCITAKSATR
jgi:hypothetical protein